MLKPYIFNVMLLQIVYICIYIYSVIFLFHSLPKLCFDLLMLTPSSQRQIPHMFKIVLCHKVASDSEHFEAWL